MRSGSAGEVVVAPRRLADDCALDAERGLRLDGAGVSVKADPLEQSIDGLFGRDIRRLKDLCGVLQPTRSTSCRKVADRCRPFAIAVTRRQSSGRNCEGASRSAHCSGSASDCARVVVVAAAKKAPTATAMTPICASLRPTAPPWAARSADLERNRSRAGLRSLAESLHLVCRAKVRLGPSIRTQNCPFDKRHDHAFWAAARRPH